LTSIRITSQKKSSISSWKKIDNPILGYKLASETEIVQELGTKHMQMGFPIVYTSADSIVQIAACEDVIPVTELYRMCETGW